MTSEGYVVSWPVRTHSPGAMFSTIGNCQTCDTRVWLSPSSQKLRDVHKLPVFCVDCAERHLDYSKNKHTWSPEGLREIEAGEVRVRPYEEQ